MANNKFRWTQHLIDCDKKYDNYYKNIIQGTNREANVSALKFAADSAKPEDLSGYAAYLLYELYSDGEYVAQNQEAAMKYLELGCSLGETECLIMYASRFSKTIEELDQKLEEIINNGCNRENEAWEMRATLRQRKSKKSLPPDVKPLKPSYFLRLKYMIKACSSLPKQKYFDNVRRRYKKQIRKMIGLPLLIAVLALLIIVIASVS